MNWIAVDSPNILNIIDKKAQSGLSAFALVFKHSTRCGISARALDRFNSNWKDQVNIELYLLDLLKYRHLSDEISKKYGIRHASPQILLIQDGQCLYHMSHHIIDTEAVMQFIASKN